MVVKKEVKTSLSFRVYISMRNKTTSKILVLKSLDQSCFDVKFNFEASEKGIQAWFTQGYLNGIAGIEWKSVETALIHAIKNGFYVPEILKL